MPYYKIPVFGLIHSNDVVSRFLLDLRKIIFHLYLLVIRTNTFINSNQEIINQDLTKLFLSYKIHTLQKVDINVLEL